MSYPQQSIQIIPKTSGLSTSGVYLNANTYSASYPTEDDNYETVSANQSLAGKANPRTKIPPIIIARPYEFEYWKDTPISKISIINKKGVQFPKLAGYSDKNDLCAPSLVDMDCVCSSDGNKRQNLSDLGFNSNDPLIQTIQPGVYTIPTDYDPIIDNIGISYTPQFEKNKQINIEGNDIFMPINYEPIGIPQQKIISIETENYEPIGNNNVSPNISANITSGEFFSNQITPRVVLQNPDNYLQNPQIPDNYNVYDPRFSGYGSDNRNYLDPVTHQTRYYYDDIDSVRMPNYLVRSKLDSCITNFGDTYGPMKNDSMTLNQLRPLAENSYLQNNLNYRNDLMESLLRKRNSEMWQIRQAPKYTQGQGRWR